MISLTFREIDSHFSEDSIRERMVGEISIDKDLKNGEPKS